MLLDQGVVLPPVARLFDFFQVFFGYQMLFQHHLRSPTFENLITYRALESGFSKFSHIFQVVDAFQMAWPIVKQDRLVANFALFPAFSLMNELFPSLRSLSFFTILRVYVTFQCVIIRAVEIAQFTSLGLSNVILCLLYYVIPTRNSKTSEYIGESSIAFGTKPSSICFCLLRMERVFSYIGTLFL